MTEQAVKGETASLQKLSKPFLTPDDVTSLLSRLFGLRACRVDEFNSYDDRIYHVTTVPGQGIGEQREFMLKVLNSVFTAEGAVETQTDILDFLQSFPELRCQCPVANLSGQFVSFESIQNDYLNGERIGRIAAPTAVRLFSFLPGKPLLKLAPIPPVSFLKLGEHLGGLQIALQKYPNDVKSLERRAGLDIWCLQNLSDLRSYLHVVKDAKSLRIVKEVITEYERKVTPIYGELRKGIVHHDYNESNVLAVSPLGGNSQGTRGFEISGVIDFDSMVYSCLVFEIAVPMMYLMFCSDQPLEATANLLAGFESRAPLTEKERGVLRVLVAGRFIQSLVLGLYSSSFNPDNSCIVGTQAKSLNLLEDFWNHPEEDLMKLWRDIKGNVS
ncbi:hydroxylysine kinase-like [Asterias amurensis]|uniref:hydroxylysine kinase-like n=1 Tax=Asterias amurensis TaxID=7602 RepID=UPI003AB44118